jgi:hypothetical protein
MIDNIQIPTTTLVNASSDTLVFELHYDERPIAYNVGPFAEVKVPTSWVTRPKWDGKEHPSILEQNVPQLVPPGHPRIAAAHKAAKALADAENSSKK